MVSTRGIRYKFGEGERVLCYEPDPTKAKVLYDSKVLEVIESKDKRGRRTVEYLIHFQGWNSSWDRCVSEDFVLKDTEENRQLQRDLAEKSQLQLGAYLYRRERKKGPAGPAAKRPRHGFSDDGSSTSTQPDATVSEAETAGDTDSSMCSSGSQLSSPPHQPGRASINLPPALRDRLTFDYHLVVKRGRLSALPASPSAAEILESFVKWFARSGAWRPVRPARPDPPQRPDLLDVCCRLNLVREVADGLRVYLDFTLRGQLLYQQELEQYRELCGRHDTEEEEDQKAAAQSREAAEDSMKSPKIPEYSHLPPDPVDQEKSEGSASANEDSQHSNNDNTSDNANEEEPAQSPTQSPVQSPNQSSVQSSVQSETPAQSPAEPPTPENGSVPPKEERKRETRGPTRRLRSHKSAVSQSESEETATPGPSVSDTDTAQADTPDARTQTEAPDTPTQYEATDMRTPDNRAHSEAAPGSSASTSAGEPRAPDTLSSNKTSSVDSSGSSVSSGWRPPPALPPAPAAPTRTPLSLLLDKVAKWQIIPREGTEHLPCRVYGAIHLARLFVKLPDFLNATQMPDMKLKLILKHIDMFVQFLDEHNEWFGEMYYIPDEERSH